MRPGYALLLYALALIPLLFILSVLIVFDDYSYDTARRLFAAVASVYTLAVILLWRDTRVNELVPDEKRALWGSLIVVGSSFAHLVYLWLYVMPGTADRTRASSRRGGS